jgi:hypothetical protein
MGKLYLFSEVRGVVTQNGKPVSGATVEQTYAYDEKISRMTQTNDAGEFFFPEVVMRSFWASIMPHEKRVEQTIKIKYEGGEYMAWAYVKHNYRQNGELDGKPISMLCALEAQPKRTEVKSKVNSVFGICDLQ